MDMELVRIVESVLAINMLALQQNRFGYNSRMLSSKVFIVLLGKCEFLIATQKLTFITKKERSIGFSKDLFYI